MEERTYVEERSFRKLQKLGGSFLVSLPKKWVKEVFQQYLDDKEEVLPLITIDILNDRSLRITPGSTPSEDIKKELILESNPYVVKELVKSILSGETYIVIRSDKVINKSNCKGTKDKHYIYIFLLISL